jgi:hypothetical protein
VDDLAAWLTQVWDEQEKAADPADRRDIIYYPAERSGFPVSNVEPIERASVLARIAADRQILAFVQRVQLNAGEPPHWDVGDAEALGHVVKLLAQPYADRPGFRDEWRVTA